MNSRFLSRVVMAAVLAGIAGCPSFEKPDLSVKTAKLASADFNGAVVDVTVEIANSNAVPLLADSLHFQGFIEGKPLVKGDVKQRVTVPAKGKTEVKVPIRFTYKELGAAVQAMRNKKSWDYEVKGEVGFEPVKKLAIALPFSTDGELPAPQLPIVTTSNPRLEAVTLQSATVAVDIVVRNDNAFALPAGSFEGTIELGSTKTPIKLSVPSVPAGKGLTLSLRQPFSLASLGAVAVDIARGKAVPVAIAAAVVVSDQRQPVKASLTVKR